MTPAPTPDRNAWSALMDAEAGAMSQPTRVCNTCRHEGATHDIRSALEAAAERREQGLDVPTRKWLWKKMTEKHPTYRISERGFTRHLENCEPDLERKVWR